MQMLRVAKGSYFELVHVGLDYPDPKHATWAAQPAQAASWLFRGPPTDALSCCCNLYSIWLR